MTKDEFLVIATAAAQESSRSSGLPPGVTVAQAALESAWGRSTLSMRANNYFGIKAHGNHRSVEMSTSEFVGGKMQTVGSRFAAYETMARCFACRDRLIRESAVYAEARAHAADPERFVQAFAKHWATDPNYAEKILKIYQENNLDKLDRKSEG